MSFCDNHVLTLVPREAYLLVSDIMNSFCDSWEMDLRGAAMVDGPQTRHD
jgi:hypothetical protein